MWYEKINVKMLIKIADIYHLYLVHEFFFCFCVYFNYTTQTLSYAEIKVILLFDSYRIIIFA